MAQIQTTAQTLALLATAKTALLAAGGRSNNNAAQRTALTAAGNALDAVTLHLNTKKTCAQS